MSRDSTRFPAPLVQGLFHQWDNRSVAKSGLILETKVGQTNVKMPSLPGAAFERQQASRLRRQGHSCWLTIDLWLQLESLAAGQSLLDTRDQTGAGILVSTTEADDFDLDARRTAAGSVGKRSRVLQTGQPQHVVITVDGGPKIITFVVNGLLCDGGDQRQFGWGRYSPTRTPAGLIHCKWANQ